MDLSTKYLGLELAHPFMPGASPLMEDLGQVKRLEDAGASAIAMHSLFEEQITLEQMATFRHTEAHSEFSAEARSFMPDPDWFRLGPEEYLDHLRRVKRAVAVPVIASLNGTTLGGWLEYARLMEEAGADALELNIYSLASDPQTDSQSIEERTVEMVRAVKGAVTIPVALKLSPFYTSLAHTAHRLVEAGADGLVLFNRFYQPDIDVDELEVVPTLHLSDSSELTLRLRWLAILSSQLETSFAVTGGVHTALDAVKSVMAGAHVVQLVSSLLKKGPDTLARIRGDMVTWMEEHEYHSLAQMRGSMNLATCPDAEAFGRANYIKVLKSWRER